MVYYSNTLLVLLIPVYFNLIRIGLNWKERKRSYLSLILKAALKKRF